MAAVLPAGSLVTRDMRAAAGARALSRARAAAERRDLPIRPPEVSTAGRRSARLPGIDLHLRGMDRSSSGQRATVWPEGKADPGRASARPRCGRGVVLAAACAWPRAEGMARAREGRR